MRNDHALCAVHNERPLVGHERDITHIDVLLFDVLDGARARIIINVEHNETHLHLERCGESNIALLALFFVELRRLKYEGDIFKDGPIREIPNREDAVEDAINTLILATLGERDVFLQEMLIRAFLHLDQVRHCDRFGNTPKAFTDTFLAGKGQ